MVLTNGMIGFEVWAEGPQWERIKESSFVWKPDRNELEKEALVPKCRQSWSSSWRYFCKRGSQLKCTAKVDNDEQMY